MALHRQFGMALVVLAGVGAVVVGCGDEEPPVNGPPFPDEVTFCNGVAKAICNEDVVEACYQSSDSTIDDDRDTCVATFEQAARCNPLTLDYNAQESVQCVQAFERAYADAKLTPAELADIAENCRAALSGNGELGTTCTLDSDCNGADELECVIKPGAAGTCQIPTSVTAGNTCADQSAECVESYYCGAENACIIRPAVGEACDASRPCVEEANCISEMCVAKSNNGQACTADDQCLGGLCVLIKGTPDGTCGAQVTLSPTAGDYCTPLLP